MYSRVRKRTVPNTRGEAVALLAELMDAEETARCTHDLSLNEFVPEGFWARVRAVLEREQPNIREIK
jgi:hypothetical protein